jgi:hypothetical protein
MSYSLRRAERNPLPNFGDLDVELGYSSFTGTEDLL